MASLKLDHIYKVYPNGVKAVNDFTMDIEDGEFIVFVGPSGCGKSTTLRMIAGLEEISAGELYIGDTLVNDMEPKDRDIAMVFQNYALYPHMTVYENMAFGLTLRHMPRNEIHEKVMWAAENLGLKEYLDRKPKAMSGGQRQRVSLGRAILRNPKVMLLDEPLSNLDAKLRSQMRSVISKLHKSLATTFIYVTHDQVEAMTLGTRVVVMKAGRVQQIDAPQNLYDHPVNKFVAGFIGTPQMNFFNVTLKKQGNEIVMKWADVDQEPVHLPLESCIRANKRYLDGTKPVTFGIRCEGLSIEPQVVAKAKNFVNVKISHFEELGNETLIYGDLGNTDSLLGETKTSVIIKASSKYGYESGDVAKVAIKLDNIHLFDSNTEMTIIPVIPDESVLPLKVTARLLNIGDAKVKKPAAIQIDEADGFIAVPLNAVKLDKNGEIEGVVGRVDEHKNGNLVYVNLGENIIFVLTHDKVKVGQNIKVTIDYSKVSLLNKDEEVIQPSLPERDDIAASFVNFKTAYETTKSEEFKAVSDAKVAKVNAEYDKKFADAEAKYASALSAIDESALPGIIQKNNAELAKRSKEIKASLKAVNAEAKKSYKEENINYTKLKKEAIKKIEDDYKNMIDKEKVDVALAKKTNKDKDAVRARVATFNQFKETLPIQKKNDINNKLNALSFDHDTVNNGIRSKLVREEFDLKSELKQLKERVQHENKPKEYAEKVHADDVKTLAKQKEDALLSAKLLFFFKFDHVFQMIPDDITNKIIQGLGNKVFTKTFKLCVPHDGYKVVENGGIQFNVINEIDYETRHILRLQGTMYGQDITLNMDQVGTIKKGDNVNIEFDIEKCQIYETGMNIRLY